MRSTTGREPYTRLFRCLWLGLPLLSLALPSSAAAPNPKLTVTVGQSITQHVDMTVKTVSIADAEIVDVVLANPHEILLNGKAIGYTTLVVWGETSSITFDVVVRMPFSDQQIELNVKIVEFNRTKAMQSGFDFLGRDDKTIGGLFPGDIATPADPLAFFADASVPGLDLAFRYKSGGDEIATMIRLLQENGLLRVLAEPRVVAASGQPANFLSGGEIPIPVAAGSQGGVATVTIEWKEFGVGIGFVPTIVDSGVVNLKVSPEVSGLDYGNAIVLGGFRVPALRTRRAQTTVELKDGEVLVIGGLMMEEEEDNIRKIPILGDIPLLGFFFTDKDRTSSQSELIFVVSANIVRALARGTSVPLPGAVKE